MIWIKRLVLGMVAVIGGTWLVCGSLAPLTWLSEQSLHILWGSLPLDVVLTIDGQQINVAKSETTELEAKWNSLKQQLASNDNAEKSAHHQTERQTRGLSLLRERIAALKDGQSLTLAGHAYSRSDLERESRLLQTQLAERQQQQQAMAERAVSLKENIGVLEKELTARQVRIQELERQHAEMRRSAERVQREEETRRLLGHDSLTRRAESSQERLKQRMSQSRLPSLNGGTESLAKTPAAAALLGE